MRWLGAVVSGVRRVHVFVLLIVQFGGVPTVERWFWIKLVELAEVNLFTHVSLVRRDGAAAMSNDYWTVL